MRKRIKQTAIVVKSQLVGKTINNGEKYIKITPHYKSQKMEKM
jgi:hypothetical protein